MLELTRELGIGAQFGGKYFCHDVRVIRLPRHGASVPIGIGVSCSADRQILGKITAEGVFLEQLETNPAHFLPEIDEAAARRRGRADRSRRGRWRDPPRPCRRYPIKTRLSLTGTADRRARHRARQAEGAARPRRRPAAICQGPPDLLRRPGQDAGGLSPRARSARPRPGAWIPMSTSSWRRAAASSCWPRAIAAAEVREACKKHRRLLSRLDRRAGGAAGAGLHQEGRGARISRARHGGDLAHRGGRFPGLHRHRRQGQRFLRDLKI